MKVDTKIDLKNAKKEFFSKNYTESLKQFEQIYNNSPDDFTNDDLITYSWAIYHVKVKSFTNENDLLDAVELITELIPQGDLNKADICPYTFSVFIVLNYLDNHNEYYNMFEWLDKLNPELLDNKSKFKSRREKYYQYLSKAHFGCGEWELCIEASNNALTSLKFYTNGEVWHKWRIAKSLRQLNKNQEALSYLNEVLKVKNKWYVKRELAENYIKLEDRQNALKCLAEAVTTKDPSSKKVNLYHLIYEFLSESEPEIAFRHVELYYLLKRENNAYIPSEIIELDIDEDNLDKDELEEEIWRYWYDLRYSRKLEYGTVSEMLNDDYGYIISNNLESVYFNKADFEGDNIHEGMYVSFLVEKTFEKSLNEEVVKAIDIKME